LASLLLQFLFFVGFMGAVLAWDRHWKSWRSIVRGRSSLRDRDRPALGASPNTAAWTVTGDHAILDCSEPVIDRNSSYLGEPDTDAISLIIRYRDSRADVDKFPGHPLSGGKALSN
jgi:hypothetical protein